MRQITTRARAARIGLRAGVQRPLAPGIRHQIRVPIDQRSAEEQAFRVLTEPICEISLQVFTQPGQAQVRPAALCYHTPIR
jgi:hypothetical protein